MKRSGITSVGLFGAVLIAISAASVLHWNKYDSTTGLVEDITFTTGEESQIVTYTHDKTAYESEYTLEQVPEQSNVDLFIEKSNPENYLKATPINNKNITLIAGVLGVMSLYYAFSRQD